MGLVTEPLDFEEWVGLLRRRIGDADAIKPNEAHDFRELMSDYADVTPPQWYHEAFDELEVWGHLDPSSGKAMGTAHGRLSADGRAYRRDESQD
jgi:hypothetical protein